MTGALRVCLVSREYPPDPWSGGIGTYTRALARGLADVGHAVTVVRGGREADATWSDGAVQVHDVAEAPRPDPLRRAVGKARRGGWASYWLRQSRAVARRVDELQRGGERFDVIEAPHWNAESSGFGNGTPLVVRLQTPYFMSQRVAGLPLNRRLDALHRRVLQRATLVAAISAAVGDDVADHYRVDRRRIRRAPLGVGLPAYAPYVASSRRILFVGRLEARKGVPELFEALATVLAADPLATADIVGRDGSPTGREYTDLADRVVQAAHRERLRLHGWVDEATLEALYRDCAFLVAPSRYESFGLVFLEAMARGRPVVGTDTGGVPEIVTDDVGALAPVHDAPALAAVITRLLAAPDERARMAVAARDRVANDFTTDAMVETSVAIYREAGAR